MSSISSYLTTNNVVYASAVCTLGAHLWNPRFSDRFLTVNGMATFAGITAVVIKERSFRSSPQAILTIGSVVIALFKIDYERAKKRQLKENIKIFFNSFSYGALVYAPISIIVTVGARIFRHKC